MSKLQTLIKDKQSRYKQNGIQEVFKKEDGAIDLASIMVGVIVIGLIGGVIATTVFAVIPWAQDNAAKQQLDSIVQAENAHFGLSTSNPSVLPAGTPANSFGKSADLKTANLLSDSPRYCVTTPTDKKSYTGYSQSASGTIFTVTDKNSKPETFAVPAGLTATDALPADCQFITVGITTPVASPTPSPTPTPYVDPTPTKTILTYKCDVTTTGRLPINTGIKGTETWSDGLVVNQTGQSFPISRSLTAGVTYQVSFDGTYQKFVSEVGWDKCLRSVDHWGSATAVYYAASAFAGAVNLTSVPDHFPATITNINNMFKNASSFNDPNVGKWDVTNVTDTSYMFYGATSFNQPLNDWNVSNVTAMNNMFENSSSFNQPLNNWNTSKVTSLGFMFHNASGFNQPLNNWNTINVTNMHQMFFGAPYTQDLSSWDMNKVTRMAFMFSNPDVFNGNVQRTTHPTMTTLRYRCDVTTSGRLPINTGINGYETWSDGVMVNQTGQSYPISRTLNAGVDYTVIFEGTYQRFNSEPTWDKCLKSVDFWGSATGVNNASGAFSGGVKLTSVPQNIPTTITLMSNMFKGSTAFNDADISNWNVSNVTDMNNMFYGATSFNQPLNNWNTAKVTNMTSIFENNSSFNQPLNNWNINLVTGLAYAFRNATNFNQPLNNWNTTNVTDMHMMFWNSAEQQDLSSWNMNKVTRMAFMFNNPDVFNGNLQKTTHPTMTKLRFKCDTTTTGRFPLSTGVTGTETWSDGYTYNNAGNPYNLNKTLNAGVEYTAFFEGTYYYLQTSSVAFDKCLRSVDYWGNSTTTRSGSYLTGATNLTSVPASIPSGITSMANMFKGDTSLNDPNISQWNVSNVTDMSYMFSGATSFNQPLNNWNVSKVTNMSYMFQNATAFNQDLKSSWNTAAVTNGTFFAPASFPDAYMPANTSK